MVIHAVINELFVAGLSCTEEYSSIRISSGLPLRTRLRILPASRLRLLGDPPQPTASASTPPRQEGSAGSPKGNPLYVSTLFRYLFWSATLVFFDTALDHNPRHKEIRKRKRNRSLGVSSAVISTSQSPLMARELVSRAGDPLKFATGIAAHGLFARPQSTKGYEIVLAHCREPRCLLCRGPGIP